MSAPAERITRRIFPERALARLCGPDVTPWRLGLAIRAFGLVAAVLSTVDLIRIWGCHWDCELICVYGGFVYGLLFLLRPRWGFQVFTAIAVLDVSGLGPPFYSPLSALLPVLPLPAGHYWVSLFPVFPTSEAFAGLVFAFTVVQNLLRGGTALYGLGRLRPPVGAERRRVRKLMGICLWLGSVALIAIAVLQLVAPGFWAADIGPPGGRMLAAWQAFYYLWTVPELVFFLFLAALLMAWRGQWGFPPIYAALVFSSAGGRTIVPAGFLLKVFANPAFASMGPLNGMAGVAIFNAAVALLVGLAHAVVIELAPRQRGQQASLPMRAAPLGSRASG